MSIRHRAIGIVLDKADYRENDQLFDLFTKEFGKIKILGKATRKINSKLRSGVGIVSCAEIEFIEGKAHKILTESNCLERFGKIFNDLEKTKVAYAVSDVLNGLVNYEERDDFIFDLLKDVFSKIDELEAGNNKEKNKYLKLIYFYFFWNLVSHLGYHLNLYNCCLCNNRLSPVRLRFSHEREGIICSSCTSGDYGETHISPETVKIIRVLINDDWSLILKLVIDDEHFYDMNRFVAQYLLYLKGISRSCKKESNLR